MQTPMHAISVAMTLLALSGCSTVLESEPQSDPDGVACEDSAGATAVWIDVNYSGSSVSTPSSECTVDPGTRITWRGPMGNPDGFRLEFDGERPDPRAPRVPTSEYLDGRQLILMFANNDSGEYTYDIVTDNGGVDPVIIIRNRN